jgi:hypothetical protein
MAVAGNSDRVESASEELSASRLTAMFLAVAAVTTIVGFGALLATWLQASIEPGAETLKIAQRQYALGHYATAADLAKLAELTDGASDELIMLREYLIGAGRAEEAIPLPELKQRRSQLHVAIPYLETASTAWPTGKDDDGDRLLGLSLYHVGQYAKAIKPLRSCIERNPTLRDELIPVIAQCLLYGEKESAREALAILDQLDPRSHSSPVLANEIESLRAQCLLRIGQYAQARDLLSVAEAKKQGQSLTDDQASKDIADKIQLLLAVADVSEAMERFGKGKSTDTEPRPDPIAFLALAMERLSILRRDATPALANQAALWAARAHACCGQPTQSLSLLTTVRQQQPFQGANIAAGIEEIEWLADSGNGEETLQTVRYLLREIGNEQGYDGTVVDLQSFRSRLLKALQTLRQQDRFEHCVAIARGLPSLFPAADALYEEALTHRQSGARLAASSKQGSGDVDSTTMLDAKKKYRLAGDTFNAAAKLRFDSKKYCDTLWEAIESYQLSGQFELCVELLDDYLRYEDRRKQPQALLALGKARLATGDIENALLPLEACIVESPRDPLRYDAQLYAALANAEAEKFSEAEKLLESNLSDGGLTPESPVWRDSLFSLGELLYRRAHQAHLAWELGKPEDDPSKPRSIELLQENQPIFEQAILRLREAAARYWPDARAKNAAYLNARAHRLAAIWPQLEAESADALDAAKRQLRQQADQHLVAALSGFTSLRRDLATREEEQALSHAQQAMLRNCYLAEADTLLELNRFEPAAEAFRAVSLRYMNEPPALEAMLGQARCLRELKRPREARMVIRQALVVLSRIPAEEDDQFLKTTRYDRKRWQELLGWLDTGPLPEESDA